MAGTIVEPSKATHGEITLDLSAAAGPAAEERQEDDQEDIGQEDGRKGGRGGGVSCFYSFGEPLTDGLTQCLCIDRTLLYS